ncbi:MAG: DUF3791 domain-containing protein [Lachnospiraceae bacterium]
MKANKILLQKKYARVIELFATKQNLPVAEALKIFYESDLYREVSQGISDMHCRSDEYLAEELAIEYHQCKTTI